MTLKARWTGLGGVAACALQLTLTPAAEAATIADLLRDPPSGSAPVSSISYVEEVPCAATPTVAGAAKRPHRVRRHKARHLIRRAKPRPVIAKPAPKPPLKLAATAPLKRRPVHRVRKRRMIAAKPAPLLHKARCEVVKRKNLYGLAPVAAISRAWPNFEPFTSPVAETPAYAIPATGGEPTFGGGGPIPFGETGIPVAGGGRPTTTGGVEPPPFEPPSTPGGPATPPSTGVPTGDEPVSPAPEPSTWMLAISAIAVVGGALRRKRQQGSVRSPAG